MSVRVCLAAKSITYPEGGGLLWMFLNWALGLRAAGCEVTWLEVIGEHVPLEKTSERVASLRSRLEPYGLASSLVLATSGGNEVPSSGSSDSLSFESATDADLLLNLNYHLVEKLVTRFRRSALLDLDPGLLQLWMQAGEVIVAPHDCYFTMGETVGQPGTSIPDVGVRWHYSAPCLALDWWKVASAPSGAPFTTVAHWFASGGADEDDDKRNGFLPYLDLPRVVGRGLELALDIDAADPDWDLLERNGWRVRRACEVSSSPEQYQHYIRGSFGELSCAKPSYVRLETAWVSERSLCYLATGKPVVVQYTGPSRLLPDRSGMLRFRSPAEAVACLSAVEADYEGHCRAARALAEEQFDARNVVPALLETALG